MLSLDALQRHFGGLEVAGSSDTTERDLLEIGAQCGISRTRESSVSDLRTRAARLRSPSRLPDFLEFRVSSAGFHAGPTDSADICHNSNSGWNILLIKPLPDVSRISTTGMKLALDTKGFAMKCILHIGLMKTGTTLLQKWLYQNQQALSAQRIWLSDSLGSPDNYLFTAYFNDQLDDWSRYMKINTLEERRAYFKGFLERLKLEIDKQSKSHDVFIITPKNLNFCFTQSDEFKPLTDFLHGNFDDVRVVCYFRNQFDFAVSGYSEKVKHSSVFDLETYLKEATPESYHFNYLAIADNWSSAFGRDHCDFKIFDKAKFFEGDLRKDFLNSLGCQIDHARLNFCLDSANESLSPLVASGYRAINSVFPTWDPIDGGLHRPNFDLKATVNSIDSLQKGKIASAARAEIEEIFDDANTAFFTKYFNGPNQFKSRIVDAKPEVQFSQSEVERIVFDLLSTILPLKLPGGSLKDGDADYLRDIAVKIENDKELALEDCLALMKLAQRARPSGPFISWKVQDYESRLVAKGKAVPSATHGANRSALSRLFSRFWQTRE